VTVPDASILASATQLAREELAPRAADYDRDAKNPVDSWRALARAGFLGATIPRAHGGLGLDMPAWCALDGGTDMGKALLLTLVHADAPGMATDGAWDTLGMRGTYSPSVTFTGVRVPADATLGQPGSAVQVGVIEAFALGYAAVYVGIAEAALTFAVDFLRKRVVKPENISVAQDPTVQRHVGELAVRLDAARLVLEQSAAAWESADIVERGLLANRAKYLASEVGLEVTSRVIQTVGGRGAYRVFPAERAFRDMRTATLMPPTADRMLETIGKSALGLTEAMFRVSAGPQAG
jgi:alkylation response protein AidB-like acyl-CoA dehydrogenase